MLHFQAVCECVSPFNFRELQSNSTVSLSSTALDESKSGENTEKAKQKKRVKQCYNLLLVLKKTFGRSQMTNPKKSSEDT